MLERFRRRLPPSRSRSMRKPPSRIIRFCLVVALVLLCASSLRMAQASNAVVVVESPDGELCGREEGTCSAAAAAANDATVAVESSNKIREFEPTHEWKEVLPGQGIPAGLHVRLNLQTGKREAKLLDKTEDNSDILAATVPTQTIEVNRDEPTTTSVVVTSESEDVLNSHPHQETNDQDEHVEAEVVAEVEVPVDGETSSEPNWNHEKIYEVLNALPEPPQVDGMKLEDAHTTLSAPEFRRQMIRLWKKRQQDLKEAIESMQDDAKYLAKILDQFHEAEKKGDTEAQLQALEVLEWEVQDLDKTHVLNFIGGFSMLNEYLNSTNLAVRAHAAWVIGTACKNYNDGQEWAINAGVIPKLLASLQLTGDGNNVTEVEKKALYALSSLIRFNARGQRLFVQHQGPELLARLLDNTHAHSVQLKAVLLMHDLLLETAQEGDEAAALTQLHDTFRSITWCNRVAAYFDAHIDRLSHKQAMEVIDAMVHQLPACQDHYHSANVLSKAQELYSRWQTEEEHDADELHELGVLLTQLRVHL